MPLHNLIQPAQEALLKDGRCQARWLTGSHPVGALEGGGGTKRPAGSTSGLQQPHPDCHNESAVENA